ncbi:hydrogen gas-evolving membrane-bound hydrogenase subunit E [Thermococcus peptonophilus]|uniref:hydrogen gas-evolving membrane-bound hydrogenase subunit E n=1 Tax=Thermococcus peptonophilus TaxID=53952 RepID=UPI000A3EF2D9
MITPKFRGGSYAYYLAHWHEVGIPNLVTAILADWRGYDSLGEATLLFAAATGFYLLLGGKWK